MRRLVWLMLPLALASCGGSKSSTTLTVTCAAGTALSGATSVTVLGDTVAGRPMLIFPDPVNSGKTGTLTVPAHDRCKIEMTPDR